MTAALASIYLPTYLPSPGGGILGDDRQLVFPSQAIQWHQAGKMLCRVVDGGTAADELWTRVVIERA